MELNIIKGLAGLVGAEEQAFRLLFSILLVYPIAWYYRKYVRTSAPNVQSIFLTIFGMALGMFNFGLTIYHSILAVLFTYATIQLMGPTKYLVIVNFGFHMTYLLVGYWVTGTDTYEILWTMPHCVLTLRLIGLTFDLWDGSKPRESLSVSNKETALSESPKLLDIFSHVFFPGSFLVGPQFSMKRYLSFVSGKLEHAGEPTCLSAGAKRGLLGIAYLVMYQVGSSYFPNEYLLSQEFDELSIIKKHIIVGIWGKAVLSKYVSCWLLTEGACITLGIAYNGQDKETKQIKWDGCRNINLGIYEGCTKFGQYVVSFNVNTNTWVAQYVYKRLAFLGNRQVSQGLTLLFLAAWHGFHTGYYMTFFMEFIIILMEKELESILNKNKWYLQQTGKTFKIISFIILKLYVAIFMGYCLIGFSLLNFSKWWQVYKSLYFSGFILFFPWMFVYKPIFKMLFKPTALKDSQAKR